MANILGLDESTFRLIEEKTIKFKLSIIDERFTFWGAIFSIDYLNSIHYYLFLDLYSAQEIGFRNFDDNEINYFDELLRSLELACKNKNLSEILNILDDLWSFQLFCNGNTRTLIAYFKILCLAFNLPFNIDLNSKIVSGYNFLRKLVIMNS